MKYVIQKNLHKNYVLCPVWNKHIFVNKLFSLMLNALSRFLLLKLRGMLNFELIFNLYLRILDS